MDKYVPPYENILPIKYSEYEGRTRRREGGKEREGRSRETRLGQRGERRGK